MGEENGGCNGNSDCSRFITRLVALFNLFLNLLGNPGLTNVLTLVLRNGKIKNEFSVVQKGGEE